MIDFHKDIPKIPAPLEVTIKITSDCVGFRELSAALLNNLPFTLEHCFAKHSTHNPNFNELDLVLQVASVKVHYPIKDA